MEILHFSDLHLGVENYGRLDPGTGLNSRLGDFLHALDRVVECAIERHVDLVLFTGDAYNSRRPNPTYQREFARRIQRLAGSGVQVFLLAGNHDKPNTPGRATSLDIFATLQVEGVHVAEQLGTRRLATRRGDVQVVALPWVTRSQLLTREEYKNKSPEEVNAIIVDKLTQLLATEIAALDSSVPAVLAMHGSVHGGTFGSERSAMLGQEIVFPLGLVADPAFDYVALGHLHKHQVLRDDPPVVYSGSLERVDFGEEKEKKGYILVEINDGKTSWSFQDSDARPFVTIDVTVGEHDPMPAVRAAIDECDIRDAIVRVLVHLTSEQEALLDDGQIRRWLSDAFRVTAVARDVDRPVRMRLGNRGSVEKMTPDQLLVLYLEAKNVDAKRIDTLARYARAVFAGDDGSEAISQ